MDKLGEGKKLVYIKEHFSEHDSLSCLQNYVREWFTRTFSRLTPPQMFSFKLISMGKNVIITAPTGSGKTLAAFLSIISELFKMGEEGKLEDSIYCVYVSPLRALSNDIQKNLIVPIKEITRIAKEIGKDLPEIRVDIRTGDVAPHKKQNQLKRPPHILITTPESIAIMLNAPKFSNYLKTIRWVIVDEIHELASSKRGVHLSLSIERLRQLVGRDFVRIGLGATLHPLEEAAKFLVGYEGGELRECCIVDTTWSKPMEVKVMCPVKDIVRASAEILNASMYKLLDKLISSHKTTIVFTNTRSGTERVVYHLKEIKPRKYNDKTIGAHHGSLSREVRLGVENKLKKGELKCVVSSTSLELGIDIGYVNLVIQIGSPKSVTRAVQRIGRSGHNFGDTSKGVIIAMDRDDLIETAVMLKCVKERKLDKVKVPAKPLDILAQHIVGMALTKKWKVREALDLIRRSYCYKDLSEEDFKSLLRYLAGHHVELEDRNVYGKIWYDDNDHEFGRRGKFTRVIYYLNLGAIPDEVKVDVYKLPSKRVVGEIEEDFLERLRPGDVFVLGGKLYRFRYARGMKCYVEDAPKDSLPTIPAWFSELLPLSFDLAMEIQQFRSRIKEMLERKTSKREVIRWLIENYPIDEKAAYSIYEYFDQQLTFAGVIPGYKEILIEDTRDLKGIRHIVFHALFGRKTNDALSRVFGIIISNMIGRSVGITVSDNGFSIRVPKSSKIDMNKVIEKFKQANLEQLLIKNVRRTELMKRRFRHCASRSFLVLRNYKGHKISVNKQQTSSETLLRVCESVDPNFPVVKETYREILNDVMDIEGAKTVQAWLTIKDVKVIHITTEIPTPFAHNLIVLGEADVILMEDRRKRLLQLHEAVMRTIGYS